MSEDIERDYWFGEPDKGENVKIIDGRRFEYVGRWDYFDAANNVKKEYKRNGYHVRIIQSKDFYTVFIRR